MRFTLPFFVSGILVPGLAVSPVDAATPNASISVSVKVQTSCLVSATTTTFTTYAAAVDAASAVSVVCSDSTPYNVRLSFAMAPVTTGDVREIPGSRVTLGYAFRSNSHGIVNWRQALGKASAVSSGTGSAPVLAIHGRFAAGQYPTAGAYADTVTVIVTY